MIWDGAELHVIEAATQVAKFAGVPTPADSSAPVIYRLSDTVLELGRFCGVQTSHSPASGASYEALVAELSAQAAAAPATRAMDIGILGDVEFVTQFGATAEAELMARINNVDGIFSDQVGVQLNITEVVVFDQAPDPFSDTTDAPTLLEEVAALKSSTSLADEPTTYHLNPDRNS